MFLCKLNKINSLKLFHPSFCLFFVVQIQKKNQHFLQNLACEAVLIRRGVMKTPTSFQTKIILFQMPFRNGAKTLRISGLCFTHKTQIIRVSVGLKQVFLSLHWPTRCNTTSNILPELILSLSKASYSSTHLTVSQYNKKTESVILFPAIYQTVLPILTFFSNNPICYVAGMRSVALQQTGFTCISL